MTQSQLLLLASTNLPYAIKSNVIAYESRTQLIAVLTDEECVDVYRLGGQRAFHIKRKDLSGPPTCLQWINSGDILLVGGSSGHVDWISARTGKVQLLNESAGFFSLGQQPLDDDVEVACLGGCVNIINTEEKKFKGSRTHQSPDDSKDSTTEWFDRLVEPDTQKKGSTNDAEDVLLAPTSLPQHLASVDIDDALPRLSPIPAPAKAAHALHNKSDKSAQKQIHALVTAKRPHDWKGMDVFFVAYSNGRARAIIDRIFDHDFGTQIDNVGRTSIAHCANPVSSFHLILEAKKDKYDTVGDDELAEETNSLTDLQLKVFRIPFSVSGGPHTQTIITRSLLLRGQGIYLHQSMECLLNDWNIHSSLPTRFIQNINETLAEKGEGNLEQNLYHLAMTGHCSSTMTEWLRDELAERGHKRWDHATTSLYHSLSNIMRVNVLPALERTTLAASTLRGLATFYEGSQKFDVEAQAFTKIINAISCAQLVVHEALQILGQEERQFRAFSRWLRHQIDLAAAEPSSRAAIELAEREAMNMDVSRVLSYIEGPLASSKLKPLLQKTSVLRDVDSGGGVAVTKIEGAASFIKKARSAGSSMDGFMSIEALTSDVEHSIEKAFGQIQTWQDSTWMRPEQVSIPTPAISSVFDLQMGAHELHSDQSTVSLIAVPLDSANVLLIHNLDVDHKDSASKALASQAQRRLEFEDDVTITSVKTLADRTILVLIETTTRESHLLRLDKDYNEETMQGPETSFIDSGALPRFVVHTFAHDKRFEPLLLVVNDSLERRNVLVLDKSKRSWQILDLEHSSNSLDGIAGEISGYGDITDMTDEGDEMVMD